MVELAHPDAATADGLLAALWQGAGLAPESLEHVRIEGDPVLPSCFRVGDVAAASTAASGLAAARLWQQRGGRPQSVSVDMAHAEIAYRSERYIRMARPLADPFNPYWGYYQSADDRWLQLHTSFPHHLRGALSLLGLPGDASLDAVKAAVKQWSGDALEDALAERGLVGALMRSREEWLAHPHGAAIARAPLMSIERIGEAPPEPFTRAERPLAGIRVLDLTRVIAGPVCGRTLAEHGAEVLRVQGPQIPYIPLLAVDTGRGKRSTFLDLTDVDDRARFEALLADTHVMVQGYRPGAIAGHGYAPATAAAVRPGIVYVSICAYGYDGPWAARRGFDSLVQMASGIAKASADALAQDSPRPLPCQALDHTVGYLAAFGATAALIRRASEGGSWHVRLSLVQVSEWLHRLGRVDGMRREEPSQQRVAPLLQGVDSALGWIDYVRPVCHLSDTPARWSVPASPMGSDSPVWTTD